MTEKRMCGTCKLFFEIRGYGFITGDDGLDYYTHYSNLSKECVSGMGMSRRSLRDGQRVEFTPVASNKGCGRNAVDVVLI